MSSIREFWWLTSAQGSPKCFHNWARGLDCSIWHADYSASTVKHCNNTSSRDAIKRDHVQCLHPTAHQTGKLLSRRAHSFKFTLRARCPGQSISCPAFSLLRLQSLPFSSLRGEPRVLSVEGVHPKPTHLSLFFSGGGRGGGVGGAPMHSNALRAAPRPGSRLLWGSLPPAPCLAPWMPQVGSRHLLALSPQVHKEVQAEARGRRSPTTSRKSSKSCAPTEWPWQKSDQRTKPRGRGPRHQGSLPSGRCHPSLPPSRRDCLSSPPLLTLSLSLFFSLGGWDSLGSERSGESQFPRALSS